MRSTPTNALLAEASEMSLEYRRRMFSLKYILNIIKVSNHPTIQLLEELSDYCLSNQGYWSTRSYPYLISAYQVVKEYCKVISVLPSHPCFQFPLNYQLLDLDFVEANLNKNNDNNILFINFGKVYWPLHTIIYTDASRNPNDRKAAIGIYIPSDNVEYSAQLQPHTQIYTAEIMAIQRACTYVSNSNLKQVLICSDSKTALQMITSSSFSDKISYTALATKKKIIDLHNSGVDIKLVWVPSHTNILGNDKADMLAKSGIDSNRLIKSKIDANNILPTVKENLWLQWQREWKQIGITKGRWYVGLQPDFPKITWFSKLPFISRKHICTIIRIRTGHALTNQHKYKIGVVDSPYCECGQIEDLNHIFFDCPINVLPDFDIYKSLISCKIPTPIDINTVISNLNFQASAVITTFLKKMSFSYSKAREKKCIYGGEI